MESKQKRTALVTGGSSGIGRCTAAALSKAGYIVYEFSRRDVPVEGVKHMCGLCMKVTLKTILPLSGQGLHPSKKIISSRKLLPLL